MFINRVSELLEEREREDGPIPLYRLARETGLPRVAIRRWRYKQPQRIHADVVARWLKYFDIEFNELLEYVED